MAHAADDQGRTLLQLAATLRLAALRLADTAGRMQSATDRQHDQVERLAALRDRVVELLAACRRLTDQEGRGTTDEGRGKEEEDRALSPLDPRPSTPDPRPSSLDPRPSPLDPRHSLPSSALIELTSWQEFEKFRSMEPITADEVAACDLDALIRQLSE